MISVDNLNAESTSVKLERINPDTTLAILLGVEKYADTSLPDLPSAERNVKELKDILIKKMGINETITITEDVNTPYDVQAKILHELNRIRRAQKELDLIIFYYSGHGLLNSDYSKYYFSLGQTENVETNKDNHLRTSALDVVSLFSLFGNTDAKLLIIIDSCYSKNAFNDISFGQDYCIITATNGHTEAEYPIDSPLSVFTGVLIDILKNGINNNCKDLPLKDVLDELKLKLHNLGKPEPKCLLESSFGKLVLMENPQKDLNLDISSFDLNKEFKRIYSKIYGSTNLPDTDDIRKDVLASYPTVISVYLANLIADKEKINDKYFLIEFYTQIIRFLSFIIIKDLSNKHSITLEERVWFNGWKFLNQIETTIDQFHIEVIRKGCQQYKMQLDLDVDKCELLTCVNLIEQTFDSNRNLLNIKNFRDRLFNLLKVLSFFKNYELLAVRFIDVRKSFYDRKIYKHEVSVLHGEAPSQYSCDYHGIKNALVSKDDFLNNSVILIKKMGNPNEINTIVNEKKFLNLWPFLVDGHSTKRSSSIPDLCIFVDFRINEDEKIFNYKSFQYIKERIDRIDYSALYAFPDEDELIEFINKK